MDREVFSASNSDSSTMPVQNIGLLKFNRSVSAAQREELIRQTLAIVRAIPEVKSCRGGSPLRPLRTNEQGYNFVLSMEVQDWPAFQRYLHHPLHLHIVKTLSPLLDGLASYQIEVPEEYLEVEETPQGQTPLAAKL